jgi:hypothetical protein
MMIMIMTKKRRLNENNETLEEHHKTQFNIIIDIYIYE